MKIKIVSDRKFHPINIVGGIVNGFDLSQFPNNAKFTESKDAIDAGIYNIERIDGELYVTLGQHGLPYDCQPIDGSHSWRGTGEWIDANDYDPDQCYIVANSAPEGSKCVKRSNGWAVVIPKSESEELEIEQ